ncbi:MAG: glycosyltransferase [Rhizomicrobium sp.]
MISVVIPTLNSARFLPRCFDGLIAATVRGVVKEVVVADGGSTDGTLTIADAAGCHVAHAAPDRASQWIAGAAMARGDWLLFLLPETLLEAGWENEVESVLAGVTFERPRAASFRFALDDFSGAARRRETMVTPAHVPVRAALCGAGAADPAAALSEARRASCRGDGGCGTGAAHRPRKAAAAARPRDQQARGGGQAPRRAGGLRPCAARAGVAGGADRVSGAGRLNGYGARSAVFR